MLLTMTFRRHSSLRINPTMTFRCRFQRRLLPRAARMLTSSKTTYRSCRPLRSRAAMVSMATMMSFRRHRSLLTNKPTTTFRDRHALHRLLQSASRFLILLLLETMVTTIYRRRRFGSAALLLSLLMMTTYRRRLHQSQRSNTSTMMISRGLSASRRCHLQRQREQRPAAVRMTTTYLRLRPHGSLRNNNTPTATMMTIFRGRSVFRSCRRLQNRAPAQPLWTMAAMPSYRCPS
jgi:hypothetical protein